jgi:S1-C subfamily serine protease
MTSLVVLSLSLLAQKPAGSAAERPANAPSPAEIVASIESVMGDAIARAEPAVVAIHRDKAQDPNRTLAVRGRRPAHPALERDRFDIPNHAPFGDDFISFDYGSGVVIGGGGEILTAFHVVRGAERLTVRAAGGPAFEAEVIAADPRSDLAVIAPVRDRDVDLPRFKPIPIGDSTRLRKGSFLIALGNPFNAAREDGSASASWGILSNTARRLEVGSDPSGSSPRSSRLQNYPTLLQLDAKLNLGMSGGAVINLKGELVGLTTTASSPAGFDAQAGYAIPMDRLGRRIVESLRQGKEVEYGLLGIQADDRRGTRVSLVTRNSPAARGLVQVHDEIIAVNGTPVSNFDALILTVGAYAPGESIRLKIRRSDEIIERTVVLAKYPLEGEGEVIATNRPRPWRGMRVDYTTAVRSNVFGAGDLGIAAAGVVVTDVEERSPAAAAGLKKSVLISRVDDRPIHSPREFAEAVAGRDGPVALETDIGAVTVGTTSAPGSRSEGLPQRSR